MAGAIDTFTAEESAQFDAMRDDAPAAAPAPRAERAAREPDPAIEIVHDEAPEAAEQAAHEPEKQKTVPHEQFHAERERRKALQSEMQKLREETAAANARMEERFRMLQQATQPKAAEPAPLPDMATDPIQHIDGRFRSIEQQAAEIRQFQEQQRQAQAQQAQFAELRNHLVASEQAFRAETPDYDAAMQHMIQVRHAELQALGLVDPVARNQQLMQDVAQLTAQARQMGRNPADVMYQIAAARGYRKAAPAPTPIEAAIEAPAVSAADRQVAAIERGRAMSTTVGTSGTAPPTRLTPDRIANMSEAEFSRVYAKVAKDPAAMRAMFGE
jgi:predicted phage tail protein